LLHNIEFFIIKSLYLLSYFDLLADISEVFGLWIILSILALSTITTMTTIQEITAIPRTLIDYNSSLTNYSKTNSLVNYKFFFNYNLFKKFIHKYILCYLI